MAGYVSDAVIRRLPGYYRHLRELEAAGVTQISSQELGKRMQLTPSQIRQDINCFGGFGRQGYGYHVAELRMHIGRIMGVDQPHQMIVVGAGNIGAAVALADSFQRNGFQTVALFDASARKIGTQIGELTVQDAACMKRYLDEHTVDIAVLSLPVHCAQEVASQLYEYGVRGFWNFAPVDLKLPRDAALVNVHLDEGLQVLSYRMLHKD
jgi:redox-sensing transcriptional repressor